MSAGTEDSHRALPSHRYEDLRTPTSIRLLNLNLNGESDDDGQIETFQLGKAPPFAALSYTWGNPYANPNYELDDKSQTEEFSRVYTSERSAPIRCNDAKVMVTHNLVDALEKIKRRYEPTGWSSTGTSYIWIDAICINQENLEERSAQVAIMGQIYATAERVFIWLGDSLPRTQQALGLIQYLSAIPQDKYGAMRDHDPKIFWKTYQALEMEEITTDEWLVLLSFLGRNWFRRVWMIQEYCLPRYTSVLCGLYRIPWMNLYLVSYMLRMTDWCNKLSNLEGFNEVP
jgi:hypothetical protein